MFPLTDSSGRVVGFSGRVFPPDAPPEAGGKYVNSPQTALYDKSRLLYGFDRAKVAIRREDRAVLVEGQLDLLLSHQAGVTNAVAVSGTALTTHHLEALGRLTRNVVMAFDGDTAGIAATAQKIGLALKTKLEVRIARLPAGQDPADLIVADPTEWPRRVAGALHVIDFLLEAVAARVSGERELAHALKREVYPYVARLRERIDQAHFIGKIAALTHLSEEVIRADIAELSARAPQLAPVAPVVEKVLAKSRLALIEERLAGLELLAEDAAHDAEIAELKRERELEQVREERVQLMRELAQAQKSGDEAGLRGLLERIQAISQKINTIKNN
jgi:DNA primase